MDYRSYLSGISFCLIREDDPPRASGRYVLAREAGPHAEALELPNAPLDVANTRLPCDERGMKRRLGPICTIPRMSTFAIGSIINHGVANMRRDQAFVNVGLWNGFTFLSGIIDNHELTCVGIDNFSQFGGPRDDFHRRFHRFKGAKHRYHDMDYVEYFEQIHTEPIGFYIYDGEHSYENQLRGLLVAEPFFADDCIILVDDINWLEPRQATMDFIDQSDNEYEFLLDRTTCGNEHPTWWNGIMVLQRAKKRKFAAIPSHGRDRSKHWSNEQPRQAAVEAPAVPETLERRTAEWSVAAAPLVSIIIDGRGNARSVETAIVSACTQTYPNIEVVVVTETLTEDVRGIIGRHDGRIVLVPADNMEQVCAFQVGFRASHGEQVLFMDAETVLLPSAVELSIMIGSETRPKGMAYLEWLERLRLTKEEIAALIPPADDFILVDEGEWGGSGSIAGRHAIPFLERDGQYWGPPPDDETAVRELERLRRGGASHIVFAWPAFWWLDHYADFRRYLRATYRCALENDRLVAFDLRA